MEQSRTLIFKPKTTLNVTRVCLLLVTSDQILLLVFEPVSIALGAFSSLLYSFILFDS